MSGPENPVEEKQRRYRNPPIEHRFRKGVSGNPAGRPPKRSQPVDTKLGGHPGIGFQERIKSLAIEEAYRVITIREGGRMERIPVVQAILRKIAVAAANGNTRAQQNYLNLLTGAEADRRAAAMEILKAAVQYKERWGDILAERARNGTTGPEPLPHPDDLIIDYATGDVHIDDPVLQEQKTAQEWFQANWLALERELVELNERVEANPNDCNWLGCAMSI